MTRPAESTTAIVGSIVGALGILLGAITDLEVSVEVSGAVVTLVSWIAAAATWWIARKQRKGKLQSAADGTVQG